MTKAGSTLAGRNTICPSAVLSTNPTFGRFLYYKLVTLVPFSAAFIAIAKYSETFYWLLAYVGLCLVHAAIVYSIKCPHCPYYKMPTKRHKCFMIWGAPKFRKPRPGPEGRAVGIYIAFGMLILTFFPVYWLRFQWELLVLYFLSLGVLVTSIPMNQCPQCINFDCKNNRVPSPVRDAYLEELAGADRRSDFE